MPRKVFTAGEILTAANLNDVSDATVMVFDDATARTTAIPTPVEGMVTYLKDTDAVEKFDGSSFVGVATAPAILQVVTATKSDVFTASLASGASTLITDYSATITPSSASSKVLVLMDANGSAAAVNDSCQLILKRDGTAIGLGDTAGSRTRVTGGYGSSGAVGTHNNSTVILDSPATTSAVVYTVDLYYSKNGGGTGNAYLNRGEADSDSTVSPRTASRITLMEVAG